MVIPFYCGDYPENPDSLADLLNDSTWDDSPINREESSTDHLKGEKNQDVKDDPERQG